MQGNYIEVNTTDSTEKRLAFEGIEHIFHIRCPGIKLLLADKDRILSLSKSLKYDHYCFVIFFVQSALLIP
jgi:hypothetical protein